MMFRGMGMCWLLVVVGLLAGSGAQAMEVAGVRLEETLRVGGHTLVLNGAGVRNKFFVDLYVGALYVSQKSDSPAELIATPAPRRIVLRLLHDISAENFTGTLSDRLKKNNSEAELLEIKAQVEQFSSAMRGLGDVKKGDAVAIDFSAEGASLSLNGSARSKVAGQAFSRALLRIWLGEHPSDPSLKRALLGG